MSITTVEVEYVNEPKPGKKMGSIKTTDGTYFSVYPDKLEGFKPKGRYEIEYDSSDFKGKTYHRVLRTVSDLSSNGSKGPAQASQAKTTPDQRAAEMFVMGFVNRFYDGFGAAGVTPDQMNYEDIATLIRKARLAWDAGWRTELPPVPSSESGEPALDPVDEVPF